MKHCSPLLAITLATIAITLPSLIAAMEASPLALDAQHIPSHVPEPSIQELVQEIEKIAHQITHKNSFDSSLFSCCPEEKEKHWTHYLLTRV